MTPYERIIFIYFTITMKKYLSFFLFVVAGVLLTYCEKEPIIELQQVEYLISEKGGSQSVSFTTNYDWSATISGGAWLTISKSAGESKTASFTFFATPNDNFDNRTATISITAGSLSKSISVSQSKKKAILITKNRYEISTEGGNIEVEVKSNIELDILIPTECQSWITNSTTKGLITNKLTFNVVANNTNDNRQGKIIFKEKNSSLSDTVIVFQPQKDAIILTQKNYTLEDTASVINVELKSNVQYLVTIPTIAQTWISLLESKALKTDILAFSVLANTSNQSRNTEILIIKSLTTISDTLTINQKGAPFFPEITTMDVNEVSTISAKSGGTIISDGGAPILNRGICWNVVPNPTIDGPKTNNGTGNGSFTAEINGLTPETKYFVRAYATNRTGTSYGKEVSFTTSNLNQYPETDLPSVKVGNTFWAPVNAGYSSIYKYGLMYQWHRKYGQTYDESPAPIKADGPTTLLIGNSLNNRQVFYYSIGNWFTPLQLSWNMSSNHNPCPPGWNVPTKSELETLMKSGSTWSSSGIDGLSGRWFGGNHNTDHIGSVFLPAAGSRRDATWVDNRNSIGQYWSCEISRVTELYLTTNVGFGVEFTDLWNNYFNASTTLGLSIRCVKKEKNLPIINTSLVTSITSNSAISGGYVEDSGLSVVIERGVVYSTNANPTTSSNKVISGSGIGNFIANVTDLIAKTSYYVRAYAINSLGTSYGPEEKFFTTIPVDQIPVYPGTSLKGILVGSAIWAPVNAGYSATYKYGLMYQWHRKYGQTYDESPSPTIVEGPVTILVGNDIENKNKFYIDSDLSDWNWCDTRPSFWDMSALYNPCPAGWRVPTCKEAEELYYSGSTWYDSGGPDNLPGRWFGGNHNGNHSGSVFLPAPGYLTPKECDRHGRGFDSTYWSTEVPNKTDAITLRFNFYNFSMGSCARGYGQSVRCVKE